MKELDAPKSRTRIIWSCSECGTVLPLWQVKCTNCHRLALSWLHLIVGVLILVPAVFILVKLV
jgi:hypothetical protein